MASARRQVDERQSNQVPVWPALRRRHVPHRGRDIAGRVAHDQAQVLKRPDRQGAGGFDQQAAGPEIQDRQRPGGDERPPEIADDLEAEFGAPVTEAFVCGQAARPFLRPRETRVSSKHQGLSARRFQYAESGAVVSGGGSHSGRPGAEQVSTPCKEVAIARAGALDGDLNPATNKVSKTTEELRGSPSRGRSVRGAAHAAQGAARAD
jgi:hypothetical protein